MRRRALLAALVTLALGACLTERPPPIQLAPGERLVIDGQAGWRALRACPR